MAMMYAPLPNQSFTVSSGDAYQSNNFNVIANVTSAQDVSDLQGQGCFVLTPPPTDLLFSLKQANFNVTTDQILGATMNVRYRIKRVVVMNASVSLTTAVGGFYTATARGGSAIVASSQAYSALTASNLAMEPTLNLPNNWFAAGTPLYLNLSTAQGAAATADIYVYGDVYN
ncbi:MAG TPA: hypothetical protein VN154_12205 [Rhizomicrobium sp.]|nr:hypothetical protein [Rhizomicrobium sp.]